MATKKSGKNQAKYKKLALLGGAGTINVYASPKILSALNDATIDMDLYQGVKLGQVLDAVYLQGKKDGQKDMFAGLAASVKQIERDFPHKNPGRPKKFR